MAIKILIEIEGRMDELSENFIKKRKKYLKIIS